ncbi:hypothetical protein HK097_009987 [Rhizophlyctis rosea]|uniref:Gluconokinase n=1 Tax=Rhizophlyctis rosea TaxID=64517 RepID=A0AAD5SAK2_9FUNG|nr:hypothetical protein HK097_009987 [Rhizophlyctis rosea]
MPGKVIIVMGVASCGKSTVGETIAKRVGPDAVFLDADDFHPEANKEKMAAGIPLDDEDRKPWLGAIRKHVDELEAQNPERHVIIACSALKRSYRDTLRHPAYHDESRKEDDGSVRVWFLYLKGTEEVLQQRISQREGHFMKSNMLKSQLATLEEPDPAVEPNVVSVDIDQSRDAIIAEALQKLGFQMIMGVMA